MDSVEELHSEAATVQSGVCVQAGTFFLELSLDWIVVSASENIHRLLGESHVTLIDEPLGRFVQSQPLHDLRNLFSRLSGTTGIARAYGVRLTQDSERVDVAFQLSGGRVLLEAVPSLGTFGECFGSVGGLIAGLATSRGQALLDGGARRMRALSGYDRVTLVSGDRRAESSRGSFAHGADMSLATPMLVGDVDADRVHIFPRRSHGTSCADALTVACGPDVLERLAYEGVRASLRVPFPGGEFRCDSRTPRTPSLELHASAELFGQLFAMQLEIDRLKA